MIPILASAYGLTGSQQAVVDRTTGASGRGPLRHRLALDTWAQAHQG